MAVSDPILHAVIVEPEEPLRRALRRALRVRAVHTVDLDRLDADHPALRGPVDLVVAPGGTRLAPGEPERFGLDAALRVVQAVRGLPASHLLPSGLRARALPIVLTVQDPHLLGPEALPGVVRTPVPLHDWELRAAAARALGLAHDALADAVADLRWTGAAYEGRPGPHPDFAGDVAELVHLLGRLRRGAQALVAP